jgi:hypothetical protein
MADKKLETFKIGDTQQRGVAAPSKKEKPKKEEASHSLGFNRIENLLEKEDPAIVGQGLSNLLKTLEELHDKSSTNKDKAAAKKAMMAVEKAVDLMDYLFQTKAAMEAAKQ